MNTSGSEIKIITGNANQELAAKIAEKVGVKLSDCIVTKFSDGEISVNINETVRGCDVFVVQSTNNPVNQYLMELLIMIDALKRASAGRITAVIPYYGYARQDRKAKSRDPITAKLVANLLTAAGADRVLTMDLHAAQIQGYFDIPVDHLLGQNLLANYFNKLGLEDITVVSPDLGSVTRSRKFANQLDGDVPLAIIDTVGVDLDLGGVHTGIVSADLLDEAAITGIAAVSHDHAVIRSLLGAHSSQSDLNHGFFLQNKLFVYHVS